MDKVYLLIYNHSYCYDGDYQVILSSFLNKIEACESLVNLVNKSKYKSWNITENRMYASICVGRRKNEFLSLSVEEIPIRFFVDEIEWVERDMKI